jgi:hypothetical protein
MDRPDEGDTRFSGSILTRIIEFAKTTWRSILLATEPGVLPTEVTGGQASEGIRNCLIPVKTDNTQHVRNTSTFRYTSFKCKRYSQSTKSLLNGASRGRALSRTFYSWQQWHQRVLPKQEIMWEQDWSFRHAAVAGALSALFINRSAGDPAADRIAGMSEEQQK